MNLKINYEDDTELAEFEAYSKGYRSEYMSEPNTIIVKEVTKKEIQDTVTELYKCDYFERLGNGGF